MIEEAWYEAYCTSAYVIGWSAVEDAGPLPDVIPVLRTADEFLDEHGLLDIIREQATRDALRAAVFSRRKRREDQTKIQLAGLLTDFVPADRVKALITDDKQASKNRIKAVLNDTPHRMELRMFIKRAVIDAAAQGRKDARQFLKLKEQDMSEDDWEPDPEELDEYEQEILDGMATGIVAHDGTVDDATWALALLVVGELVANTMRDSSTAVFAVVGAMVNWVTMEDDAVDEECDQLAKDSPYLADAVPGEPHFGCRCTTEPAELQ